MKTSLLTRPIMLLVPATLSIFMISCSASRKLSQVPESIPGISIKFVGEQIPDTVYFNIAPIPTDTTLFTLEYVEAMRRGREEYIPVKDNTVHIALDSVPSVYNITLDYRAFPPLLLRADECVDVTVSSLSPLTYDIKGVEYISPFSRSEKFYEFYGLQSKLSKLGRHKYTKEEFSSNVDQMSALLDTIFPETTPEAASYIMSQLADDIVVKLFDKLPSESRNTLYYPYVCALRNTGAREIFQQDNVERDLATSATMDFYIESLDGTSFNISSLRGKWVVIDFWVSWCNPCKRGFEKMKKIYANHMDKLEVVAIACGDQSETWQRLIEELELSWINLLAPSPESHEGTVGGFPVPAYPTKIVIDPEGRLRDFIIGEDDAFYDKLLKMLD